MERKKIKIALILVAVGALVLAGFPLIDFSPSFPQIHEIVIGEHSTRISSNYVNTTQFNSTGNQSYLAHGNWSYMLIQGNYICLDVNCSCYLYENASGYAILECV